MSGGTTSMTGRRCFDCGTPLNASEAKLSARCAGCVRAFFARWSDMPVEGPNVAEREQQRASECIDAGCIWYRHANGLNADLTSMGKARDAWREFAEHVAHCVECGQMSYETCVDGKPLYDAAKAADGVLDHPSRVKAKSARECSACATGLFSAERGDGSLVCKNDNCERYGDVVFPASERAQ